jgi:NAD+ kinase
MTVRQNGRLISACSQALFCHETPAAASRYVVTYDARHEEQVSSGFGSELPPARRVPSIPRRRHAAQIAPPNPVREPFAGGGFTYRMTKLFCAPGKAITVTSKMRDACLFLDGPFQRTAVRLRDRLEFRVSDDPLYVLGLTPRRGRVH